MYRKEESDSVRASPPTTSGYAAGHVPCGFAANDERPQPPATSHAASPPDVRRGFAPPEADLEKQGALPLVRPRAEPGPGAEPNRFYTHCDGEAEPRLTSGGIAVISR
jgi:hypothetical protein